MSSRYEHSKISEFETRIEKLEKEITRLKYEDENAIKSIAVSEIIFDKSKVQVCVNKINNLLNQGYKIFKQYQTDSGLVLELTMGRKAK
jgi:hypothetical protein